MNLQIMSIWNSILGILNEYGGLIGLVSLLFSFFIWITTGNIKKSIAQYRQINENRGNKRHAVKHLSEITASIDKDGIYDNAIKLELLMETNKLLKYKAFLDFPSRCYIYKINWILKSNSISSKNADQIVSLVAKLCGRMYVEPVNTEVR